MKFVAAFNALGYAVANPRQDWSSEKADGICITIWIKEMGVADKLPYLDLRELHPVGADWTDKPGNILRKKHLQRALIEFGGRVDVILLDGTPGGSYENANPWIVAERGGRYWQVSQLDPASGFFRADIQANPAPRNARK